MSKTSIKISLTLIAFVLLAGCNTTGLDNDFFNDAEEVRFEEVEKGHDGSISNQNLVLRQEARFIAFWDSLHQNKTPIPELPAIDFSSQMVIASTMETQPTGGYSIEIVGVRIKNGILGVKVLNTMPGDGCITTQAFTTPYHLVKLDKRSEEIQFFEEEQINECNE